MSNTVSKEYRVCVIFSNEREAETLICLSWSIVCFLNKHLKSNIHKYPECASSLRAMLTHCDWHSCKRHRTGVNQLTPYQEAITLITVFKRHVLEENILLFTRILLISTWCRSHVFLFHLHWSALSGDVPSLVQLLISHGWISDEIFFHLFMRALPASVHSDIIAVVIKRNGALHSSYSVSAERENDAVVGVILRPHHRSRSNCTCLTFKLLPHPLSYCLWILHRMSSKYIVSRSDSHMTLKSILSQYMNLT